jgi:5,10-methylenetetrahydromethanopterin reductase
MESPEHARIAEQLGYCRAWFYDSPPILADVWVQLARAADRTERIVLGPGVLIPSLRHPITNASAIATLVSLAGADRVVVGIGSGYTGRLALGQRPLPWAEVARYIRTVKALLRGEEVEWEGRLISMMAWPGFLPDRPITVPFVVAAAGPKGIAVARQEADGVMGAFEPITGLDWSAFLAFGTVLRPGEGPNSRRVLAAAGHGAAVGYHFSVEFSHPEAMPLGKEYAAAYDDVAPERRHLELHRGHLVGLNERDSRFVTGDLLAGAGLALPAQGWRDRMAGLEEMGVSEFVYQPAGDDIPGELEALAEAARG